MDYEEELDLDLDETKKKNIDDELSGEESVDDDLDLDGGLGIGDDETFGNEELY